MRAIVSILSATLVGALVLQSYYSIWHPSSFGRFAEFPVLLIFAFLIVALTFLLLIVPGFGFLRHRHINLHWGIGIVAGLLLGFVIMLLFLVLGHAPVRLPELVAGSLSGAVGVWSYAKLTFKKGS